MTLSRNFLGVAGVGLHFQQVAYPFPRPELSGVGPRPAGLVHPVRRDAGFRHPVHLLGADLDLDGGAERSEQRRMQGLVAVRLRERDVVLEPPRHRLVQAVRHPQDAIAVVGLPDDDPESVDVEHVPERQALGAHLPVQAVEILLPALDPALDAFLAQAPFHRRLDPAHDPLAVPARLPDLRAEDPVAARVEGAEAEVLQLDPDVAQPEAVGDGRVDVERFARDAPPLVEREGVEGAHVVQPVRELDEDDPDVAGHRHQHLAEVLGLRLRPALEREVGELAHSIDQLGDLVAELDRDLGLGGRGVLDDVVEERCHDRAMVEAHLGEDLRDLHRVVDVGLARGPALSVVGVGAEAERAADRLDLRRVEVRAGEAAEVAGEKHAVPSARQGAAVRTGRRGEGFEPYARAAASAHAPSWFRSLVCSTSCAGTAPRGRGPWRFEDPACFDQGVRAASPGHDPRAPAARLGAARGRRPHRQAAPGGEASSCVSSSARTLSGISSRMLLSTMPSAISRSAMTVACHSRRGRAVASRGQSGARASPPRAPARIDWGSSRYSLRP